MKEFKARASAAGKLLVQPRSKTETLSETTKTYLQEWTKEQIYGMRKEINSKYMTKGTVMEDESIDRAIEWAGLPFTIKNEQHFEDEFFTGTPDLILSDTVVDIKNSWDFQTFPLFADEVPNRDYLAQLQCYMALCGKRKAKLIYVLLNTPEWLQYEQQFDYTNIDPKYRCKVFDIEYDSEMVQTLQNKVIEARNYINSLNF